VIKPVSPVGRSSGARRANGGRRTSDAARVDPAPAAPAVSAPIPPLAPDPVEPPVAVSAQILGQSGAAETAAPANSAEKARAAYLDVEWSGGADRRNRRGRIAKADI
jgi:hypothetical protein